MKYWKITLNHFINFLIRTLQFVILPFCFTLSRTILKLRYKRSSYRLTSLKTVGVIYKRNGKTEVERGVNTRERGDTNILIKNKEIKKVYEAIWRGGSHLDISESKRDSNMINRKNLKFSRFADVEKIQGTTCLSWSVSHKCFLLFSCLRWVDMKRANCRPSALRWRSLDSGCIKNCNHFKWCWS